MRGGAILGLAALLIGTTPVQAQDTQDGAHPAGIEAAAMESRARRPAPSPRNSLVTANEAKRRLAQAELQRKLGAEPLAGEFTRTTHGISVNYRYWQRQDRLRAEVDRAQKRVNVTGKRAQPRTAIATLN